MIKIFKKYIMKFCQCELSKISFFWKLSRVYVGPEENKQYAGGSTKAYFAFARHKQH